MSCRADGARRAGARRVDPCRRGFTLIELLVVIAVVATLAAVVAPSVFRNVGDAKTAAARSQIEAFTLALTQYRVDNDDFPSTEQGLDALRVPSTNATLDGRIAANWRGPYLSRVVPMDPWGRPYVYRSPGVVNADTYDLYTLGRDGRPGGEGEDADLTSWGEQVEDGAAAGDVR